MTVDVLNRSCFERCPVWTWNESRDGFEPVTNWQPLPDDEATFFIKSRFTAPGGVEFDGYLMGLETFYAFALFVGDDRYSISYSYPKMVDKTLANLRRLLEKPDLTLFPLHYQAGVCFEGKPKLQGVLTDPRTDEGKSI